MTQNQELNDYETPEVFDLGPAESLTLGRPDLDWPDSITGWKFIP